MFGFAFRKCPGLPVPGSQPCRVPVEVLCDASRYDKPRKKEYRVKGLGLVCSSVERFGL